LSDLDPDGCLVADQPIKEKPDAGLATAVFDHECVKPAKKKTNLRWTGVFY
jgi:hypothetical protein